MNKLALPYQNYTTLQVFWQVCTLIAEVTGFEPARAFTQHAFQACALNHSATLPITGQLYHGGVRFEYLPLSGVRGVMVGQ